MKKHMLRRDFFVEIRKSRGRFISIFLIVALGVAFYSGIRASEPSMRISGDAYFDKEHLMDVKVKSTLGLTDEDVEAIEDVDGIGLAEGSYSMDALCETDETEQVVHVMAMQDAFNDVQVSEGRLPEGEGECLIDEEFALLTGYGVGDAITLSSGNEDALSDSLTTDRFEIVGVGNSPLYISFGRGSSTIGNGRSAGSWLWTGLLFAWMSTRRSTCGWTARRKRPRLQTAIRISQTRRWTRWRRSRTSGVRPGGTRS